MSATINALNREIKALDKKIDDIKRLVDANPYAELNKLHIKFGEIRERHKSDFKKLAELMEPLVIEEKKIFAVIKKQRNLPKLLDKEFELKDQKQEIETDLFYLKMQKGVIDG